MYNRTNIILYIIYYIISHKIVNITIIYYYIFIIIGYKLSSKTMSALIIMYLIIVNCQHTNIFRINVIDR